MMKKITELFNDKLLIFFHVLEPDKLDIFMISLFPETENVMPIVPKNLQPLNKELHKLFKGSSISVTRKQLLCWKLQFFWSICYNNNKNDYEVHEGVHILETLKYQLKILEMNKFNLSFIKCSKKSSPADHWCFPCYDGKMTPHNLLGSLQ